MPVSLREWLPENHLAWFAIASKEVLAHADIVLNPADGTPLRDSHRPERA
jgi:hypothetical protein